MDGGAHDGFRENLAESLLQELAAAQDLLGLLHQEEQSILSGRDGTEMETLTARKQQAVETLRQATNARMALMERRAFPPGRAGVERCIGACDAGGRLRKLFDELSITARECLRGNNTVGRLLNRRGRFISRALACLSQPPGPDHAAYGRDGRELGPAGRREFGRA